jgi:superfamily II DNA or RNA helicase
LISEYIFILENMPALPKPNLPSFAEIRRRTQEVLGYRPCLWQIRVVEAILRHDKDIIAIAATGSGKTLTFWMPLLFRKDGIQVVITPLNILRKQNVESLKAMGIQGITVTAENAHKQTFKVGLPCHIVARLCSPSDNIGY